MRIRLPGWFKPTFQSACQTAHFAWGMFFACFFGVILPAWHGWPWWSGWAFTLGFATVKEFVIDFMPPEEDSFAASVLDFVFYVLGCAVASGILHLIRP